MKKIVIIALICSAFIQSSENKKAIVIGASSGMGREIAKLLYRDNYKLGIAARRPDLLESLQKELPDSIIQQIDVSKSGSREKLKDLIQKLNGIDLLVISISAYLDNRTDSENHDYNFELGWKQKERTLNVDAKGFIAMADLALEFFVKQKHGHLAGISSTSGLMGFASTPEYSGAKACISTYMEGIRNKMKRENIDITITDIIPGFVAVEHSPFGEDPNAYWEITSQEAGKIIFEGIKQKKDIVYVPKKVWLISLLKYLPKFIYHRYFNWL